MSEGKTSDIRFFVFIDMLFLFRGTNGIREVSHRKLLHEIVLREL